MGNLSILAFIPGRIMSLEDVLSDIDLWREFFLTYWLIATIASLTLCLLLPGSWKQVAGVLQAIYFFCCLCGYGNRNFNFQFNSLEPNPLYYMPFWFVLGSGSIWVAAACIAHVRGPAAWRNDKSLPGFEVVPGQILERGNPEERTESDAIERSKQDTDRS